MKEKVVIASLSILVIASSILLGFNYQNYAHNRSIKDKYEKNINDINNNSTNLDKEIELLKKEYEQLLKDKEKLVKDYEEWEEKVNEVKSYLPQ